MIPKKCDICGRFARTTVPVWGSLQDSGIDHEACLQCAPYQTPDAGGETPRMTAEHFMPTSHPRRVPKQRTE